MITGRLVWRKILKVWSIGNPKIIDRLSKLKTDRLISAVCGDYKGYKNASKAFAELAVDNFEMAKQAPAPIVERIPLFSKAGMNIAKCLFLDMFRIFTPAERKLRQLVEFDKLTNKK